MAFFRRNKDGVLGLDESGPHRGAKTVVAAAMPMNGPGVARLGRIKTQATEEQWQKEGWYFFDAIGELRGPLAWIANAVSQADLHATELDPETGKPTGPSEDSVAKAAAAQVLGGPAQRSGHLRTVALQWQVAGESWTIVRPGGAGKPDQWFVLSGEKVHAKGSGASAKWMFTDPYTLADVTLGPNELLFRTWNPHPNDQSKADSAVRPALPICREVEKSSQNIAARLVSRLAMNGVWMVPEEIDFPLGEHDTKGQAVMDFFLTLAEQNIQNPGQAAGATPMVLTVPGELIGNAVFQDFATAFDGSVVELRQDALRRLASTLDMPKDVAEGTQGESNHWSAWQVEESTYKIFIEPLLKAIGDAITEQWFRPTLVAMGKTPEQAALFEIGWDTTAIVARPDDREVLESLYDKELISGEYMLTESGIPLDAMPNDEERTRRILEKAVTVSPSLLADPNVAEALGLTIVVAPAAAGAQGEVEGGELEAIEPSGGGGGNALPSTQGEEPEPEAVPEGLVAAAEALVMQALDRAGGRLLTNQNRGQFKATPRPELYQHIRPEDPASLVDVRFTDGVAEAFGYRPALFKAGLHMYVTHLLTTGGAHSRDEMVWYLR